MLGTGFSGQLKGWWDTYLTHMDRSIILNAIKEEIREGKTVRREDSVSTLLYAITKHFVGDPVELEEVQKQMEQCFWSTPMKNQFPLKSNKEFWEGVGESKTVALLKLKGAIEDWKTLLEQEGNEAIVQVQSHCDEWDHVVQFLKLMVIKNWKEKPTTNGISLVGVMMPKFIIPLQQGAFESMVMSLVPLNQDAKSEEVFFFISASILVGILTGIKHLATVDWGRKKRKEKSEVVEQNHTLILAMVFTFDPGGGGYYNFFWIEFMVIELNLNLGDKVDFVREDIDINKRAKPNLKFRSPIEHDILHHDIRDDSNTKVLVDLTAVDDTIFTLIQSNSKSVSVLEARCPSFFEVASSNDGDAPSTSKKSFDSVSNGVDDNDAHSSGYSKNMMVAKRIKIEKI
ncbi:hypothetical protein G2W53_007475 [Senna tora]|uniref:DUF7746 domain-containing protein n=1 Tax=Senna tora TaxID=362788 RepID=A0A834X7N9_9FABA|nr:hypothetical protein G2W53_007475 [Senna tora]